jgi:capsule polysaccharide export protein KpsE/RkpR
VESLRRDTVVHDLGSISQVEFPSLSETAEAAQEQPAIGLLASLQLLWDGRRLLFWTAIWAVVVSTAIAFLIPRRYESTASIMPPDSLSGGSGTMMAMLAEKASPELAGMAGSVLGMKNTGALFVDLVRSRTVQDDVVDRFQLQNVYGERYKQDARKILSKRTDISEDRKSGVITLTVTDKNPQRARDLAQAYVEELNHLVSEVSTSSARRERIFIEQRIAFVKGDLEDAEKQFGAFASKNTALDIKEQSKAMVESAAVLQGQLIAAQSELKGLQQIYTTSNVRVRAAAARIEELQRELQKISGTDASLLSDAASGDELYPSIRKLPLLGAEWADLYRRMKIQATVYELLNQQYELARIQEAKEVPTVNLIDPANLPEKKSWPPRLVIIALLTSLSLAGMVMWIIGSERIQSLEHDDPRRRLAMRAAEGLTQLRERIANHRFRNRSNSSKLSGDGTK